MNIQPTIRPYDSADLEPLVQLWQDCGLVKPWNDPHKDIARKLAVDPELLLVALLEGELVATVMVGYEGHRGWINYLAVSPAQRRSGLGRLMMAEAEQCLLDRGCPKINLQVRSSNREVIAFYLALGYAVDDVVGMGKRLEKD